MSINLSNVQKSIVLHNEGALLVVAGPGSGKTRVLTERVRRLLLESQGYFKILAVTFTNKAANEMKDRLSEYPKIEDRAFIGTLHSFCIEVLANRGKHLGFTAIPHIFERQQDRRQILTEAIYSEPLLRNEITGLRDSKAKRVYIDSLLEQIKEVKIQLKAPEQIGDPILKVAYEAYNEGLSASHAIDFDDLLLLTYRLFLERPKIAEFYRKQYRYICIDEAQDLNEAQYKVINALCGSSHKNVMLVGDPNQAIFVWNGASPKYMELFQKEFLAKRVELLENYRSSKKVVEAARALYPSYSIQGQLPINGEVGLIIGKNEEGEAQKVILKIKELLQSGHGDVESNISLDRIAILGRTRYVMNALEELVEKEGWDYYKQLSSEEQSESDLLRDFELGLRLVANPRDQFHYSLLADRWSLPESDLPGQSIEFCLDYLDTNSNSEKQLAITKALRVLSNQQPIKFMESLIILQRFADTIEDQRERALILQDVAFWRKHWDFFIRSSKGGVSRLSNFLSNVALGTTTNHKQEGLALLTVHSAKGLEFDIVFVMGMAEGVFPDYRATGKSLEEEQRNAFVATTRSRRLLFFSYPKTRIMPWGDVWTQEPSRYLRTVGLVN